MKIRKSEIKRIAKEVTCEQLMISGTRYEDNKHLTWEELGADSLDLVEIVMCFEEELGIEFSDEVAETIRTPKQAIKYLIKNFS